MTNFGGHGSCRAEILRSGRSLTLQCDEILRSGRSPTLRDCGLKSAAWNFTICVINFEWGMVVYDAFAGTNCQLADSQFNRR